MNCSDGIQLVCNWPEKVCFLCVSLKSCCVVSTQVTDYTALYDRMRQSVTLWTCTLWTLFFLH